MRHYSSVCSFRMHLSQPPLPSVGKLRSTIRTNRIRYKLAVGLISLLMLFVGLLPVTVGQAAGQDGNIDPTFMSGIGPNNIVYSVATQSDGKILIGGDFTIYKDKFSPRLARLNSDGSLDTSFTVGTGANALVRNIAVQSDGKILIGGDFTAYNDTSVNRLARLNTDGSLDASFNSGGAGPSSVVLSIVVQPDGKIFIGGGFATYNGVTQRRVARLNSDGSLDASFIVNESNSIVNSVAVQSDGKVLIGGFFTSIHGIAVNRIARLNTDGSFDSSFNVGTGTNSTVNSVAVQSDGKVLIGGDFTGYNGTARNRLARLNTDGSLDTSFTVTEGTNSTVRSIVVQSDGKILIGGYFVTYDGIGSNRLARLNPDSSLDASFNIGTGVNNAGNLSAVHSIAVQSDGKIIIGGDFTHYNGRGANYTARLNTDGSFDISFIVGTGANSTVNSIAVQNDGKILIGGNFTTYNGVARSFIARLNSDGNLDFSFNVGIGANGGVLIVVVQNDGKILIGGAFSAYNGTFRPRLARLNSDGSLDASFNPGLGANNTVRNIVLQNDGKVLIGGDFTSYNGNARNRIARLNSDGSLDASFNPGSGADNSVNSIAVQSDGKVLIGGDFTAYNGNARNRIARLNSDGSLDASFNPGSGADNSVNSIAMQNDGKILIGGNFISYNGLSYSYITRLNPDGNHDSSFNPAGWGTDNSVNSVAVQSDGKIFIGGQFSSYNSTAINRIAKLNSNGSLDASFNPGSGANNTVNSIAMQNDGKIIIGGLFTSVVSWTRDRVARLKNRGVSITTLNSNSNPSQLGQSVTFTAITNFANASGIVQFNFEGGTTVTSTLTNGVASYVTSTLPVGDTPVTATYSGDDNFLPGNSSVYTQTVTKIPTSLSVTSSPNPSPFGQAANFTATIVPASVTGTINFTIGASQVSATLSNGVASYVTTTLAGGDYAVSANYGGSPTYSSSVSTGQYTHTVSPPIPGSIHWQSASYQIGEAGGSAILTATRTGGTDLAISVTVVISDGTATSADYSQPGSFVLSWANGESGAKTFVLPIVNDTTFEGNENLTLELTNPTGGASLGIPVTTSLTIVEDDLPPCNPQMVTNPNDNGTGSICGTFSHALATTASGTITFALATGNTITFTGSLTPTLKPGVAVDGGVNGIVLNGNGVAGDGLRLGGNNTLTNLTIRNFGGRELIATLSTAANQLFKIKVQN